MVRPFPQKFPGKRQKKRTTGKQSGKNRKTGSYRKRISFSWYFSVMWKENLCQPCEILFRERTVFPGMLTAAFAGAFQEKSRYLQSRCRMRAAESGLANTVLRSGKWHGAPVFPIPAIRGKRSLGIPAQRRFSRKREAAPFTGSSARPTGSRCRKRSRGKWFARRCLPPFRKVRPA